MKQTGRIRRFLSLALTLIMAVSLLPAAAAGESATQYGYLVIQSNTENRTVNFRRLPNTNDNTNYPLAHLPEYWVVQVLASAKGSGEDWYQVLANVNTSGGTAQYRTGYVMAKYVTLMTVQDYTAWINSMSSTYRPGVQPAQPTQAPDAVVSPTQPPVGMSGFIRTIQQGVNLRESPDGKVLNENNQIPLGTVLAYYNLHIANGYTWALVQYDGKAGYVRSDCYAFSDAQGNLISTHTGQPAEVSREQVASSDPGTPAATLAEEYGRISGLLSSAGGSFNASVPNELVILLNNERGREGLPALTFNGNSPAYQLALCRAAMMALTSSGESNLPGYGKLSSMCAKYGVSSGSPSENMLITSASSAEAIHAALQSSSGSSARMSSAYTEIAVAIAQRGGNFFIVEVFIR